MTHTHQTHTHTAHHPPQPHHHNLPQTTHTYASLDISPPHIRFPHLPHTLTHNLCAPHIHNRAKSWRLARSLPWWPVWQCWLLLLQGLWGFLLLQRGKFLCLNAYALKASFLRRCVLTVFYIDAHHPFHLHPAFSFQQRQGAKRDNEL